MELGAFFIILVTISIWVMWIVIYKRLSNMRMNVYYMMVVWTSIFRSNNQLTSNHFAIKTSKFLFQDNNLSNIIMGTTSQLIQRPKPIMSKKCHIIISCSWHTFQEG